MGKWTREEWGLMRDALISDLYGQPLAYFTNWIWVMKMLELILEGEKPKEIYGFENFCWFLIIFFKPYIFFVPHIAFSKMGYKAQRQRSTAKSNTITAASTLKSTFVNDHRTSSAKFAPQTNSVPSPCISDPSRPIGDAHDDRHCAGCHKPITERYLLKAQDQFWHEDCLRCGCCDCRLGEVGATMYLRANLILCKRDYLR